MDVQNSFISDFQSSNGVIPRDFGCTAFVHIDAHQREKLILEVRASKCVFLVTPLQKGIYMLQPTYKNNLHLS